MFTTKKQRKNNEKNIMNASFANLLSFLIRSRKINNAQIGIVNYPVLISHVTVAAYVKCRTWHAKPNLLPELW